MSEAARPVLLTPAAEADLAEIRTYTEEAWGEAQWLVYFADILAAFERIAVFPLSGRARGTFVPGLRSAQCREHVIFYLPDVGGTVVVQRILHGARNAAALNWGERRGGGVRTYSLIASNVEVTPKCRMNLNSKIPIKKLFSPIEIIISPMTGLCPINISNNPIEK